MPKKRLREEQALWKSSRILNSKILDRVNFVFRGGREIILLRRE